MLTSIILFLLVFTVIALVHEGGHFLAAKRAGMNIPECGIGFGPKLFSFTRGETTYSLNLIPILAYVNIAGMDDSGTPNQNIPESEKYFSRPPLSRLVMAFMGPFMNIILAFIVLFSVSFLFGVPSSISNYIDRVQANSIASAAGLKSGDQIVGINGISPIKMEDAIKIIHSSKNTLVHLKIQRNEASFFVDVTPKYNDKLNVSLIGFTPRPVFNKVNILQAFYYGAAQTISMIALMFYVLWQLVVGAVSVKDLAGPVGIAQITGSYAGAGSLSFFTFLAFLNVNIAIINLLPLPALDGGHIVFALIEIFTKKKVSEAVQKKVHQWGLIFLLCLMFLITINDVFRILKLR